MNLVVEIPPDYSEERGYVLSVLLGEFLGLDFEVRRTGTRDTRILGGDGRELVIADQLFRTSTEAWLTTESLPPRPLKSWDVSEDLDGVRLVSPQIPVIFGCALPNGRYLRIDDNNIHLGIDIFGSAFFMLTRYEEAANPVRDQHGRFPGTSSLAYQEEFLERPIVNEYLEILWACLKRLWPQFRRRPREYRVVVTHDVDQPLSVANKPWSTILRNAGGDLVHRKDMFLVPRRFYARLACYRGNHDADPSNTFDFIMDLSEHHGLRDAFYFITECSPGVPDGDYSIDMPWVRKLMRRIHARGHEIGLHPSYNSFKDTARTRREFVRLLSVAEEEGIKQCKWGGRQHYLRWEASTTWRDWEEAGLSYDSTLSFADQVGFRCGVCFEYPAFNLQRRRRLQLHERPLVVMEVSLLSEQYMNLTPRAAREKILTLARRCKDYNGQFTLLWHNSSMLAAWEKRLYRETIESIA
jgi:Family of unknown function (DUF7033)